MPAAVFDDFPAEQTSRPQRCRYSEFWSAVLKSVKVRSEELEAEGRHIAFR